MSIKISPGDRRFLLWAAVIIVPLIIASAILTGSDQESEIPSSYSADSLGAKAAYLCLQEQGYQVERWEQSPLLLPQDAHKTVLVMASPFTPPTREEKAALQLYLSRGGKILVTGSRITLFLPETQTEREAAPSPLGNDYQPQLLTAVTRSGRIHMSPGSYWLNASTSYLAHYADNDRPIVVSWNAGRGEVIWWASSGPLSNRGLKYAGNLGLLLNSIGNRDRRVLWDEYFHGSRQSLGAYWFASPLKYGLLQCLLVLFAALFTFSRRSLPIRTARERSRLSPLEFVQTLGGLYRRAQVTRAALEVPYARFHSLLTRRLGLAPDTPAGRLAAVLRTRPGYQDESFSDLLRRIDAALKQDEPAEENVLALTQELNQHAHQLKLLQENLFHADRVPGAPARPE